MSEAARGQGALARAVLDLLAVDPVGLGGVVLRGGCGPARDAWLAAFRGALAPETPWRRMPAGIAEDRLIGGLDLAATLAAGRPVAERGLLAEADGGVLLVPSAERLGSGVAAQVGAALDTGHVVVERDGVAARTPARFAALILDEGIDDERAPPALAERVAFRIATDGLASIDAPDDQRPSLTACANIEVGDDVVEALAAASLAFGVSSLRAVGFALRAAKAAAALAGRTAVVAEDAELAAALVLAPRATQLPAEDEAEAPPPDDAANEPPDQPPPDSESEAQERQPLADSVVEATKAAIPADLLAMLGAAVVPRRGEAGGRAGALRRSTSRGRPAGVRRGHPGHGARLAVVETLRAAAPWQRLRRASLPEGRAASRVLVRRDDFRIARFKERSETLTIFAVDASGSAALHRLAEVKGAVELVLADCYVRRDSVALIAFRGDGADLILPPTRSLTRAKRALGGQPGGGGTPLAAAIEAAAALADAARRKGQTPLVVLLTDGRANVARDGQPGRAHAEADAALAARTFQLAGIPAVLLDISPRPSEPARRLAGDMGARYVPLPYADAHNLSRAVQAAAVS